MSERAGIEVSERGNEGIDRRNDAGKGDDDLTEVGNDVYTARNVVGERVATDRRLVVGRMAVRTAVAARRTQTTLALPWHGLFHLNIDRQLRLAATASIVMLRPPL